MREASSKSSGSTSRGYNVTCKHRDSKLLAALYEDGVIKSYYRCRRCGAIYVEVRPLP